MKRFEYKIESFSYLDGTHYQVGPEASEEHLNQLAREGWELVSVVSLPEQYANDEILVSKCEGKIVFYLKREITE